MTTRWKMTCALAALAGCGGAEGDEATGSAVAAIETVPASVRCIRLTLRGATRSFDVTGGAAARLDLGALPSGTMSVTGAAYDVACADIAGMTQATWVSDPASVAVSAGITTDFVLAMRPNTSVAGRVDFIAPVAHIAAGGGSTFALMRDGTVRAWGANNYGQLGDGRTVDRASPVTVALPAGVQQITAGYHHACALSGAGAAFCWGRNGSGQLGDGTTVHRPLHVTVADGAVAFRRLSAGDMHTCGITADASQSVRCWGSNQSGQLGDGTTIDRLAPTATEVTMQVANVFAGSVTTCFTFATSGIFRCFGSNEFGVFGAGVRSVGVSNLSTAPQYRAVRSFALQLTHSCGASFGGEVRCAGNNSHGQLGDGTLTNRDAPLSVLGLSDVTQVAGSYFGICALRADSSVWCWGGGALGDGKGSSSSLPRRVPGLTAITELAAGYMHVCALRNDGALWCWGSNFYGQLGNGTIDYAFTPVRVQL